MYEEALGTDWSSLSADDALRRMFALGVATALDHPNPSEYRRLLAEASTPYQRNVLELAFKEGTQRARRNRREFDDDGDVFETLVHDAPAEVVCDDVDDRDPKQGLPDALKRSPALASRSDELERLRLPSFLRRE